MGLTEQINRAAEIMARYGMTGEDIVTIVKILVDAGVEKCLDEQQRLRQENDALVRAAFSGGLVH